MKKTTAFLANNDDRTLFHTARSAREAEFDALVLQIFSAMGRVIATEEGYVAFSQGVARNLRGGIYPPAADAFIAAAKYLEQHRLVLIGVECDPEERVEVARNVP